jgi:hypothetical protein
MKEQEMAPKEFAEEGVAILAERLALLYYAFVQTMIEEVGEEKAELLTKKAIELYGGMSGERTEEKVLAQGFEPLLEHYKKGNDLPAVGWKKGPVPLPEGAPDGYAHKVEYCPFAKHWKDLGFEKWGRLYCGVDQAKYAAYGKGFKCVHDKNMLDGDEYCIVRVEKGSPQED